MHLAELIVKAVVFLTLAEHEYVSGNKGNAANTLSKLSDLISGSITNGPNFCAFTEPMPDTKSLEKPAESVEDKPSYKPDNSAKMIQETS